MGHMLRQTLDYYTMCSFTILTSLGASIQCFSRISENQRIVERCKSILLRLPSLWRSEDMMYNVFFLMCVKPCAYHILSL